MAFDAAQILRQTYAAGADAARMGDFAQQRVETAQVERGQMMGMSVVAESNPMSELMDSMEELSFQFEEKEMKRAGERKMGEMQGPRTALVKAIETWMQMMPDMPNQEFMAKLAKNLRGMAAAGQAPDARELLKAIRTSLPAVLTDNDFISVTVYAANINVFIAHLK